MASAQVYNLNQGCVQGSASEVSLRNLIFLLTLNADLLKKGRPP